LILQIDNPNFIQLDQIISEYLFKEPTEFKLQIIYKWLDFSCLNQKSLHSNTNQFSLLLSSISNLSPLPASGLLLSLLHLLPLSPFPLLPEPIPNLLHSYKLAVDNLPSISTSNLAGFYKQAKGRLLFRIPIVANLHHLEKRLKKRLKDTQVLEEMVIEMGEVKGECDRLLSELFRDDLSILEFCRLSKSNKYTPDSLIPAFLQFQQIHKKSTHLIPFETSVQHFLIQSFTADQNLLFKYCYQLFSFLSGNQQHMKQD
jgi:hypothetical protein